uniref:Uncharacterized protein n=1 Tax=Arundo donax TaxID=35708 RepID=A0A0A9HRV5_ARUDO
MTTASLFGYRIFYLSNKLLLLIIVCRKGGKHSWAPVRLASFHLILGFATSSCQIWVH